MTTEGGDGDFLSCVADILMAMSNVGDGDYATRLKTDLASDHPVAILYAGINEMISSLAIAETRTAAYRHELEEKLSLIEVQRLAILELSTPIMEMWENVLCLPVVGVLDSTRAAEMMESLLRAVVEKRARFVIIDITGIQVMDTATTDHFIRMAKAVRLLGARCALTGINPTIAQTIVHMGVELGEVATHRNLRDALTNFVGASPVPAGHAQRALNAPPRTFG